MSYLYDFPHKHHTDQLMTSFEFLRNVYASCTVNTRRTRMLARGFNTLASIVAHSNDYRGDNVITRAPRGLKLFYN